MYQENDQHTQINYYLLDAVHLVNNVRVPIKPTH